MKKILSVILIACTLFGCEDFLDYESKTKKDTSNYPKTPSDASELLTGVYSILARPEPLGTAFMVSELMSDDRFGGGGPDDRSTKAIDQFKKSSDDMFLYPWKAYYFGVYRSNFLISVLNNIAWKDQGERDQIEGEVHFLRAHFYFDLSRMFGEVPLITTPESANIPKTPAEQTFAVITSDLKTAIEKLPAVKYENINKAKDIGRVTKWAAQAQMARVFLFYTGYYRKDALPLPDGGSVTKQEVINWLADCIDNSGHDLVDDFRNLWPYSYVQDAKYTKDNELKWVGDGNKETLFAIKFSTLGNWTLPQQKSNQICLYFGLRGQSNYSRTFPYGAGWGMGTVNSKIWDEWDNNDIRKKGSILNAGDTSADKELQLYVRGGDNLMDETLLWQKKYMPVNVWANETKTNVVNYSVGLYGMVGDHATNFQVNNTQDLVLMRFADVLLMAAELGAPQAQNYLNRVRGRVGLGSVPATIDNIKQERRFELAFEGVRYYDLLRWHDESLITSNQTDISVYNRRVPGTKTVTFRPETRGFLQIPKTEINLSGGILTQNPGWEGSDNYLE